MCTTTSLTKPKRLIEKNTKAKFAKPNIYQPSFRLDAFTHSNLQIITMNEPNLIYPVNWGLVPDFEKGNMKEFLKNYATYNARRESLFKSPIFGKSIFDKRCLIIADGFFEPHHVNGNAQAYYAYIPSEKNKDGRELFVFAGLYTDIAPQQFTTTIITMPSDSMFSFVHNKKKRMPLVLDNDLTREWLLELNENQIKEMLQHGFTSKEFYAHPVTSQFYKNRSLDSPEIIKPKGKVIKQSDENYMDEGQQGLLQFPE